MKEMLIFKIEKSRNEHQIKIHKTLLNIDLKRFWIEVDWWKLFLTFKMHEIIPTVWKVSFRIMFTKIMNRMPMLFEIQLQTLSAFVKHIL